MDNLEHWKRKAIEELQLTHQLSMASLPSITARQSQLVNPSLQSPEVPLPPAFRPIAPPLRSNGAARGRNHFHGLEENVSMYDVNRLVELTRPLYRQPSLLSVSRQEPLPPPLPPAPLNPSSAFTRTIAPQTTPPVPHQPSSPRTQNGSSLSPGAIQKRPKLYRGGTVSAIQHPRENFMFIEPESGSRMAPACEHHLAEVSPQSESASLKLTGRTIASQESRRHLELIFTAAGAGNYSRSRAKERYRSISTTVPQTSPNEAEKADLTVQIKCSSQNATPSAQRANTSANASPTAAERRTPAGGERRAAELDTGSSQVSWMACGGVNYKVTTLPSSGERGSLDRLLDCSSVASQPSGLLQHDATPFYVLHMDVPERGLTKIFAPKNLTSFQIMKILLGKPTGLEEQLNRYFESACLREGIRAQPPVSPTPAATRGAKGGVPLGHLMPTRAGGFAVSSRGHVRSDPQPPPSLLHPHLPRSSLSTRDPLARFQRAFEDQYRPHHAPAFPRPSQRPDAPYQHVPNAAEAGQTPAGPNVNTRTPSVQNQSPALTLPAESSAPSRMRDAEQ